MNNVILGVLDANSAIIRKLEDKCKHSAHMAKREFRMELSLEFAEPLYFYEVFRKKDRSRQIHCLYEDSSLVVYNKSNGKIITVILLSNRSVSEYLEMAGDSLVNHPALRMCSNIHDKFSQLDSQSDNKSEIERMRKRKMEYVRKKCS